MPAADPGTPSMRPAPWHHPPVHDASIQRSANARQFCGRHRVESLARIWKLQGRRQENPLPRDNSQCRPLTRPPHPSTGLSPYVRFGG